MTSASEAPAPVTRTTGIREERVLHAGFASRALVVDGEGPPMLLLHGFTDSADTWRPLLEALARRGRHAIAVDLPSHGRADSVRMDGPAVPQLVDFAQGALTAAGPGTVIVGNSLGGMVGLLLAERRPLVDRVVAIGPAAFDHPRWLSLVLHPRFLEATAPLPSVSHRIGFSVLGLLAGMPTDYLPTYWSHLHDRRSRRRLRDLSRRLNREARAPYEPAQLGCSVLLLWGDRDRFSLLSGARAILETYPDARLEVLPGAGHCPQLQVPDHIADLLLALP